MNPSIEMVMSRLSTAGFYADPEIVSLSGWSVTSEDIRLFDNKWMTQAEHDSFIGVVHNAFWLAYNQFGRPFDNVAWMIGERLAAMARMYELTRALKYLDELHELANLILAGRDDRIDLQEEPAPQHISPPPFHPNPPSRADGIRGNRVMPAWGYKNVHSGGYHTSDLVIASIYAYPIAAFARIVAEDPALHATYGADAKAAATDILEMLEAFRPELHDQSLAPGAENYFANPIGNHLLTPDRCFQGYSAAYQAVYAEVMKGDFEGADDAWTALDKEYQECNPQNYTIAGFPLAHNEYQAFLMVLIELSRALDSDLYKADLAASEQLHVQVVARQTIPAIVAGAQRYYRNRFSIVSGANGRPHFLWHHVDNNPLPIHDLENTNHGVIEMSYLGLLWRNKDRLNALLASSPAGSDQIMLSAADMSMLANTFLDVIVKETHDADGHAHTHLAVDLSGKPASPIDSSDGSCDGWLNLAEFDSLVYNKCEIVILHQWDPDPSIDDPTKMQYALQPHLGVGNHAALLAIKQFRATDHRSASGTSVLDGSTPPSHSSPSC